ncbi:hypothetical protein L1885_22640, partial [Streptomyces fuscigenes]|nr:hypothetical protein [Streptomyces fuscigenes]
AGFPASARSPASRERTPRPPARCMYEHIGAHVSDWGAVMATAVVSAVPVAILLVLAQKYVAAGISGGSVK